MSSPEEPEPLSPAERRLQEHLLLLRDAPDAPASLTERVLHTARWQQTLRSPLLAVAHLATAVADGIRLLLGGTRP